MSADDIQYSDRYYDNVYEYRHVILPPELARIVPRTHLLSETEWRNLGVQQSPGWVHYFTHTPEPHVLLFRRPKPKEDLEINAVAQSQNQQSSVEASSTQELSQSQTNGTEHSQATSTTSNTAVIWA